MVLDAQAAVTPAGKPEGDPIPVTSTEVCVIFGVNNVLIHSAGVADDAPPEQVGGTTSPVDSMIAPAE